MNIYLPTWHWPILFFGVRPGTDAGHHWLAPDGRSPWGSHLPLPDAFAKYIDGTYAPADSRESGRAVVHHVHGLTVLAFWDYSADERGGCNGNFVAPGHKDYSEMLALAEQHFPRVMERVGPLKEVEMYLGVFS